MKGTLNVFKICPVCTVTALHKQTVYSHLCMLLLMPD